MPAMKISVAMPTPFQTSTAATLQSASAGSVSQPGVGRPTAPSALLMIP